ncbi:hypothetical protein C8J57DRAFT_1471787 [Mycena rebaudengoi]|nr:hypothetical protein C8J57DRAFT_1471787 [Mycena rebaudengoi]
MPAPAPKRLALRYALSQLRLMLTGSLLNHILLNVPQCTGANERSLEERLDGLDDADTIKGSRVVFSVVSHLRNCQGLNETEIQDEVCFAQGLVPVRHLRDQFTHYSVEQRAEDITNAAKKRVAKARASVKRRKRADDKKAATKRKRKAGSEGNPKAKRFKRVKRSSESVDEESEAEETEEEKEEGEHRQIPSRDAMYRYRGRRDRHTGGHAGGAPEKIVKNDS